MKETSIRRVAAVVVGLLVVAMGANALYRSGPHSMGGKTWGSMTHRCDLSVYTAAGRAVLEGADIYEVTNPRGWNYTTPPLLAIVMAPLAMLPMFWASLMWYVLSVAMVLTAVRMCARAVSAAGAEGTNSFALCVVPPLLVMWLILSALAHGQTSILMLWLVIAALYYDGKGRGILSGVCLAGAALVKVFPVLLLGYFVWRGKWRVVSACLVALMLGLFVVPAAVFGWEGNIRHLSKWISRVAGPSMESEKERENDQLHAILLDPSLVNNQSLQAVLWRLTGSPKARAAAMLMVVAMASVMVLVGRKSHPRDEPLLVGAAVVWTLLAPPVSWAHYYMVLLFPLAAVVWVIQQTQHRPLRKFLFISLGLYAVLALAASPRPVRYYGTLCWAAVVLWVALIVAAARHTRELSTPGP